MFSCIHVSLYEVFILSCATSMRCSILLKDSLIKMMLAWQSNCVGGDPRLIRRKNHLSYRKLYENTYVQKSWVCHGVAVSSTSPLIPISDLIHKVCLRALPRVYLKYEYALKTQTTKLLEAIRPLSVWQDLESTV